MTYKLFKRVMNAESLADMKYKASSFLKFFAFGPFILIASLFIDSIVFFYNLYTMPEESTD